MREIKLLLLSGAVEVIAEVEPFIGGLTLHRPYRILAIPLPMQSGRGLTIQMMMHFIPLSPSSTIPIINIGSSDMIGELMEPSKEARDSYLQMVSGIQIAH